MPRRILLLLGISHLAFGEVINLNNELRARDCPNWGVGPPGWVAKDTPNVYDAWKAAGCDFMKDADGNVINANDGNAKLVGTGCCGCWGYRILADDNNLSARNGFDVILAKLNDKTHKNGIYDLSWESDKLAGDDRTKILKDAEDSEESDSKEPWSQGGFILCPPSSHTVNVHKTGTCLNQREHRWTTEEKIDHRWLHMNDGVRCRNYGRVAACKGTDAGCPTGDDKPEGLCMWEFMVDADNAVGTKDDDHKFVCHTTAHWRELDATRGAEKAGMWIGIIFIAILMAWPACSRMPCYKKLCTAEHDLCCKTAKEEIKRRSTLQGNTSERELTPDRQQETGPE